MLQPETWNRIAAMALWGWVIIIWMEVAKMWFNKKKLQQPESHEQVCPPVPILKRPRWAAPVTYEYDLGMATSCSYCGNPLVEGTTVYEDTELSGNDLYCSITCCLKVGAL